jgi:hypothetical protein
VRACLLGETRLVFHAYFRSRYFCRCSPALRTERSPASTTRLLINLFPTSPSERNAERGRGGGATESERASEKLEGEGRQRAQVVPAAAGRRGEWRPGSGRSGNPGIGREAVEGDGRNKKFLARRQVFLSFSPLPPQRLILDLLILPLLRAAQASCQERRAAPT